MFVVKRTDPKTNKVLYRTDTGKYDTWSEDVQDAHLFKRKRIRNVWWFKDHFEMVEVKIVLVHDPKQGRASRRKSPYHRV